VPEWRAAHWKDALQDQAVEAPETAAELQRLFDAARIELFRFEPAVKVSQTSCLPLTYPRQQAADLGRWDQTHPFALSEGIAAVIGSCHDQAQPDVQEEAPLF